MRIVVLTLVIGFVLTGCANNNEATATTNIPTSAQTGLVISETTFSGEWIFTVDRGVLRCADGVVTFESGESTFAVNDSAIEQASTNNWAEIGDIVVDNPDGDTLASLIEPMITLGEGLCEDG